MQTHAVERVHRPARGLALEPLTPIEAPEHEVVPELMTLRGVEPVPQSLGNSLCCLSFLTP